MASKTDFTEREQKLMALAWQCFEEQPKVNFDKLAGLAGFTNTRSASNAWALIKKKLAAQAGDVSSTGNGNGATNGSGNGDATPKPTPSKKRGKKAAEDGEGPAKKVKKTAGKAKVKKEIVEEDEADAEGEIEDEGSAGEARAGGEKDDFFG